MSKPKATFVDSHGRTWPGLPVLAIFDPVSPTAHSLVEVTDVDFGRKLVQIRTGPQGFAWINPDSAAPPAKRAPRKRKEKAQ